MLTDKEKERLDNRETETASVRARNELVIRNKLGAWLNGLDDVLFILEHLPEKQLRTVFVDDGLVYRIFDLAKISPSLRQFTPVYGSPKKPIVVENEKSRAATITDLNRARYVTDLINALKENYETDSILQGAIWSKIMDSQHGGEPYSLVTAEKEPPK